MRLTKLELFRLSVIWISWQVFIKVASLVAPVFLAFQPSYPYSSTLLATSGLPQWLYAWAGFDGVHYLTIAIKGYVGTGLIQAFFPVLPFLIREVSFILPVVQAALLVSLVSSMLLVYSWYIFSRHFFNQVFALKSLIVVLLFPTSFFFSAVYTESLFLSLVLLAFYLIDIKKYFWVLLITLIATATRITGVFLVPALITSLLLPEIKINSFTRDIANNLRAVRKEIAQNFLLHWKAIGLLCFGLSGLIVYMLYLKIEFNDPFYFYHVQAEFGGGRQESIILWPQVVWRYIKIFMTQSHISWQTLSILQEFIAGVIGLFLVLISLKWFKHSWVLFAVLAALLPTLTGTFSSMPRYILLSFPLFLLITKFLNIHPRWNWFYFLISGMLLFINTMLFIQGYWVA